MAEESTCIKCGRPLCFSSSVDSLLTKVGYREILQQFYGCWNPECDRNKQSPVEKIRNRKSYDMWKKLHGLLVNVEGNSMLQSMLELFEILDDNYMFGTETRAWFSLESLEQFIKDSAD